MKRLMNILLVAALVLGYVQLCQADETKNIEIKTEIPPLPTNMDVKIFKVMAADCTGTRDTEWTEADSIDFGRLVFDDRLYTDPATGTQKRYNLFRTGTAPGVGGFYYVVDVAVTNNSPSGWTITHKPNSVIGPNGKKLDNNINVGFAFAYEDAAKEESLVKLPYISSWVPFKKSDFPTGSWLRIYYGIASGLKPGAPNPDSCQPDGQDVVPITSDYPPGPYRGTVELTLTTQ